MRILSAFVLSTLALAAPMVHADEAKPAAPAQSEKAPAKKSSSTKVQKADSRPHAAPDGAKEGQKPADAKPAQKVQPRRTRSITRSSSSKTTVAK
jgi:hypothetical protein